MPARVCLIVEDIRFAHFLRPAMYKLAEPGGIALLRVEKTSGCRASRLRQIFEEVCPEYDLVVVGADAKASGRATTHRKKAKRLADFLEQAPKLLPAVAQPSVEAWLMADPKSFADGLEDGTGEPFQRPSEWPLPKSEAQAKEYLGRLIHDGLGGNLPGTGFEYSAEIVARLDLPGSTNSSLAAWARAFAGRVRRLV